MTLVLSRTVAKVDSIGLWSEAAPGYRAGYKVPALRGLKTLTSSSAWPKNAERDTI